jgi:N-acetyltransferase
VIAEEIEKAYPVIIDNTSPSSSQESKSNKEDISPRSTQEVPDIKQSNEQQNIEQDDTAFSSIRCSKTSQPASCGISRIWIHPTERRKGIATKMLDAIRTNFIYGCSLTKSQMAFTQPTPDGKQFFSKYTGIQDFLVYSPPSCVLPRLEERKQTQVNGLFL